MCERVKWLDILYIFKSITHGILTSTRSSEWSHFARVEVKSDLLNSTYVQHLCTRRKPWTCAIFDERFRQQHIREQTAYHKEAYPAHNPERCDAMQSYSQSSTVHKEMNSLRMSSGSGWNIKWRNGRHRSPGANLSRATASRSSRAATFQ